MWWVSTVMPWAVLLVAAVIGSLAWINQQYMILVAMVVVWLLRLLWIIAADMIDRTIHTRYKYCYSPVKFYVWWKVHKLKPKPRLPLGLSRDAFSRLNVPMQLLQRRHTLTVEHANWLLSLLTEFGGNAELVFGLGPNDCAFWVRFDFLGKSWRILRCRNEFSQKQEDIWLCASEHHFDAYTTVSYQEFLALQAEATVPYA